MKGIVIVRISISWVLPELFLTVDFSVFIYIMPCFGMTLFPVTQHSTKSSMMDICWGRMGRVVGVGVGGGDGQKTDKHQRSISVQLQLTSSCVRLPHNYPLLPPGFIWSETLVSDVWIDRANSHACPNGITISPMRGCMYIQKEKEETLICVAVCEKWPNNTAWKCCRMWNDNDDKTEETAAQQKSVAFKWKYGLMEFICARQWVTAEPCCAALEPTVN